MKLRKVIYGMIFLCVVSYPLHTYAGGKLSGIGLLAEEEEEKKPDIYQVTLPTGNELDIVLDPQGLFSVTETGEYDSSWAGRIHRKNGGGAMVINRSSFPVVVSVGLSIEQDTNGTPSGIELLKDDSCVDDSVWPQMYLTAVPGASKIRSISDFVPSDRRIPILANGGQESTVFSFLLDGSDYVWDEEKGGYVLADGEDNYDSASFILDGRVNRNGDWSAYVGKNSEKLIIRAVFTIQKQGSYDVQRLEQGEAGEKAPYALIKEED